MLAVADEPARLPVPNFAAGGVATPADAALVMQLGAEAVFVGSGIFHSSDPARTAAAIVKACAQHANAEILLEAARESATPMRGIARDELPRWGAAADARSMSGALNVGVLGLQGGVEPQREAFRSIGITTRTVRSVGELEGLTHLVMPGGESTTLHHLLDLFGLWQSIVERYRAGQLALFGTCAGAVLLGRRAASDHAPPPRMGLLDATLERNAHGTQLHSGRRTLRLEACARDFACVFIRAPRFRSVGAGARVLATEAGEPILVQGPGILAASFHPELAGNALLHRTFLWPELWQLGDVG